MFIIGSARAVLSSVALVVSLVTAPALAQDITVTHAQGEIVLDGIPQKVFTFDVASLDTLHALGIEVAGVPSANFPERLSQYGGDEYLKIGSLFEPDYELINAEQPDLIIVAGRSSAAYPQLSQIAPTIDLSIDWLDFVDTIKQRSEIIGEIFDKEDDVAARIAAIDADIATINAVAPTVGNGLVAMAVGNRLSIYGPASRFGWIHDDLGIVPAAQEVQTEGTHGESASFEFVLEADPDWLFVINRDAAVQAGVEDANAVFDNEFVRETRAFQNDQIVYLDSVNFYVVNGGLNTLQLMVNQVGEAIGADLD